MGYWGTFGVGIRLQREIGKNPLSKNYYEQLPVGFMFAHQFL